MKVGRERVALLLLVMLMTCSHAAYAIDRERGIMHALEFREVATERLQSGDSVLLLIHQQGADFIVQVESDEGTRRYDTADSTWGVEVVLLENFERSERAFRVSVAQRHLGVKASVALELIVNPDELLRADARDLMQFALGWYDQTLKPDAHHTLRSLGSTLTSLFTLARINSHLNRAEYEQALGLIEQGLAVEDSWLLRDASREVYFRALHAYAYQLRQDSQSAETEYARLSSFLAESGGSVGTQLLREFVRMNYGMVQVLKGVDEGNQAKKDAGAEVLQQGISRAEALNDLKLLAEGNNHLSGYFALSRRHEEAMQSLRVAERLAEQSGSLFTLPMIKNNLAYNLTRLGNLGAAQRLYLDAAQIFESTGYEEPYAALLSTLADSFRDTGDLRRAAFYWQRSLPIFEKHKTTRYIFKVRSSLATWSRMAGDPLTAVEQHKALQQQYFDYLTVVADDRIRLNIELAEDALALGDVSAAHSYALAGYSERDSAARFLNTIDAYMTMARVDIAGGDVEAARLVLQNAAQLFVPQMEEPDRQLELLELQMQVAENTTRRLAVAEKGQMLIERVRDGLAANFTGPNWDERTHRFTSDYGALLLMSGKNTDVAFDLIQRNRATNLAQIRQNSASELQSERLELLWRDLMTANRELLAAEQNGEATEALESVQILATDAFRSYFDDEEIVRVDAVPLSVEQVKNRLDAGEAALTYVLGESASFAILVSKSDTFVRELPPRAVVENAMRGLLDALSQRQRPDMDKISSLLVGGLPIGHLDHMVIEASGLIGQVPFSALRTDDGQELIERMAVTFTPSLSSYFSGYSEPNRDRVDAIVLADPESGPIADEGADDVAKKNRGRSTRLPYTRKEARSIQRALNLSEEEVFVGARATRENLFKAIARNPRILHLASHGYASQRAPNLTGFLLAGSADDELSGLLTNHDIGQSSLDIDLAVISGCNTSSGEVLGSEGAMSLSRAFLSRGARATVGTLWLVSDRGSSILMESFYKHLQQQDSVAVALRMAKLDLRSYPQYRQPHAWSSFILTSLSHQLAPLAKDNNL